MPTLVAKAVVQQLLADTEAAMHRHLQLAWMQWRQQASTAGSHEAQKAAPLAARHEPRGLVVWWTITLPTAGPTVPVAQ